MAKRPPLTAETRDGVASVYYLWLMMGFMLALLVELAVFGFEGLMNVSLGFLFAVPLAVGLSCMGLIWVVKRAYGAPGVVAASWTGGGMYVGMFAAGFSLRLFMAWQYTMPILLAGMAAGSVVGLLIGRARVRRGDHGVWQS